MKFIRGNNDHEIALIDSEENVLGKGYIYEGLASKITQNIQTEVQRKACRLGEIFI